MGSKIKMYLSKRTFIILYLVGIINGVCIASMASNPIQSINFQVGIIVSIFATIISVLSLKIIVPLTKKVISENNEI